MQTLSMIGVEEQMALLRESLCPTNGVPRLICVTGQRGTGKSTAVAEVLSSVAPGYPIARLNTTEWLSHPARSVYASVLDQLCAAAGLKEVTCTNCTTFFHGLQLLQQAGEAEMMYIVVDKAERLSQVANGKILEVFRSLSQLSQAKVAVVLISTVPWYALVPMQSNVTANVVEVHFEAHDSDQLKRILQLQAGSRVVDGLAELWTPFVNLVVDVCFHSCRDLKELSQMAETHFEEYCSPVVAGELSAAATDQLYQRFRGTLTRVHDGLFLRMELHTESSRSTASQMPMLSRYLLVAGYLATYLPPTTHLKWFTNLDSKKRKRRGNTKALAKDKEAVTHAFSEQRLEAIVLSLLLKRTDCVDQEDCFALQNGGSQQVLAQLVSSRHFVRIAPKGLVSTRYRCIADRSLVMEVASQQENLHLLDWVKQADLNE